MHQLLPGAWPVPQRSCSSSSPCPSLAPPARRARPPQWPASRRRRAPAAARRLAGAITFLQLITGREHAGAAGAPRAAAAVASTTSMSRTCCCTAPSRRHHVPAADHRPGPRRRAARGRCSGQHHVDGVHKLLASAWPAPPCSWSGSSAGNTPAPPARRARPPRWPAPRRCRAPAAARRLAGAIHFLQLITGRDHAGAARAPRAAAAVANTTSTACSNCCTAPGRRHPLPAADHRPGPRRRRRRAALEHCGGQHHVDGIHKLLASAWPAPPCSWSGSSAGNTPAPPARRARPLQWPTPRRRRAPTAARRLAGAIHFLQLITGRDHAGAAGAPRSSTAVASTTSTAYTSCWPAPGRRHLVPGADHRPGTRRRRRRAARGRCSGQHHVDGVHKLLASAWPAPPCSWSGSSAGNTPAPPARRARPPRWPAPRRCRAPAAARRLAGAITFLQLITGRDHAGAARAPRAAAAVANTTSTACSNCCTAPGRRHPLPAADHRPGPRRRRRRAALEHCGGQHHVDGIHKLLASAWPAPPCSWSGSSAGNTPAPPARRARPLQWPTPRRRRAPTAARRLAGAIHFLQQITGRDHAGAAGAPRSSTAVASTTSTAYTSCWPAPGRRHLVPGADHRPGTRRRRRRAARGRCSGQHHVDGVHKLLASAWPAPQRSCSSSSPCPSLAPPARRARPPQWPASRRRRAPAAARRLAGAITFLQLITGREHAGAAGAPRAAAAVASTTSMSRTCCCTAPSRRHHVPAADHRPGPRRRAARGRCSGQHHVDGVHKLLASAWPAPSRFSSCSPAGSARAPPARRARPPRASTTSTACTSCCTAPGRRHHVPAADHRQDPRRRRRRAARGRRRPAPRRCRAPAAARRQAGATTFLLRISGRTHACATGAPRAATAVANQGLIALIRCSSTAYPSNK
ncbi:hypothetical protein JAB4_057600 (plasmid) [Janthinobacterium sp. HH102]|nr:hypothetical protein JAB4_057600 [Janthinobacterium sp. HH102]